MLNIEDEPSSTYVELTTQIQRPILFYNFSNATAFVHWRSPGKSVEFELEVGIGVYIERKAIMTIG